MSLYNFANYGSHQIGLDWEIYGTEVHLSVTDIGLRFRHSDHGVADRLRDEPSHGIHAQPAPPHHG
jgi:hypothetical protein